MCSYQLNCHSLQTEFDYRLLFLAEQDIRLKKGVTYRQGMPIARLVCPEVHVCPPFKFCILGMNYGIDYSTDRYPHYLK